MTEVIDFFFSPYQTPQERRLHAALANGLAHGSRIEPSDPSPGKPVTLLFSTSALMPIDHIAVYYTIDGIEPAGERGTPMRGDVVFAEPGETVYDATSNLPIQQWRAVLPAQTEGTLVRYRADGWSQDSPQQHWYADYVDPTGVVSEGGLIFAYHVDTWTPPQWWHDAVVYHIFVDRFSNAHDEPPLRSHQDTPITAFFGGTLAGIIEKLDYIQALGANCIWLSPIFESPTHHGYNISDHYTVATRYGTNDTLRQLIQQAHQRSIRVLLDFVANHTADAHPLFLTARTNPDSESAQWYSFGDQHPHGYRSYAHVRTMPELVTDHPGVQRYLFDAALNWLEYFGADGLRLDYVSGPSHTFWTLFQREIKTHFPQALTLGEITGPLEEIAHYSGRMDAFMDFPLTKLLREVFAQRKILLRQLLVMLDERKSMLPAGMSGTTLLDNHDMHRFLWLAEGNIDRLKLAATCHMTVEGTPIVYYGTEVGLSQYDDAHRENAYARAPMLWGAQQNLSLLAHYRHLINLRHTYPVLRSGSTTILPVDVLSGAGEDAQQVGAYLRHRNKHALLIVLNNSEHNVNVRISLSGLFPDLPGVLSNLLAPSDQQEIAVQDGQITLELTALQAVILAAKD